MKEQQKSEISKLKKKWTDIKNEIRQKLKQKKKISKIQTKL